MQEGYLSVTSSLGFMVSGSPNWFVKKSSVGICASNKKQVGKWQECNASEACSLQLHQLPLRTLQKGGLQEHLAHVDAHAQASALLQIPAGTGPNEVLPQRVASRRRS